jgi:beta-lactamase regulating signal transducer with metallopeptidase domain
MIVLWVVYSTLIAAAVGLAAATIERAGTASRRRFVWLTAVILSVAIPVWMIARSRTPNPAAASPSLGLTSRIVGESSTALAARVANLLSSTPTEPLSRYDTPFLVVWSTVAALGIVLYSFAMWSLARRRRAWRSAMVNGERVLVTDAVGPAVVGTLRPEIVVPEWSLGLPEEQRALMIEHERQHVSARDPLMLHAAALVAMLMPWNVAIWWLNRRLRLAVELDCDARVLSCGHDAHTYGTLLLNVCSRRQRVGPVLAPALFERTSSLTKRVLAMSPQRPRFPRSRFTLGAMVAAGIIVLACEMPSPEMLAPDGKDVKTTRLLGKLEAIEKDVGPEDLKKLVAEKFAAVARGEGGPSILFVVKSSTGDIVMTERQSAENARTPVSSAEPAGQLREKQRGERTALALAQTQREPAGAVEQSPRETVRFKVRSARGGLALPTGVGSLRPDDIATVDVSKHGAGVLAPNSVSIVTIVLKPGTKVPQ